MKRGWSVWLWQQMQRFEYSNVGCFFFGRVERKRSVTRKSDLVSSLHLLWATMSVKFERPDHGEKKRKKKGKKQQSISE